MLPATPSLRRLTTRPVFDTRSALGFAAVQWWVALGAALLWLGVVALAAGSGSAQASTGHDDRTNEASSSADAATESMDALSALVQSLTRQQMPAATGTASPRVEVVLGALDSRLRLAPCRKVRAYWPAGQRAWGAARVGVRCEEGQVHWNVYWPVVVKVWVRGVVAQAPMVAGQVIQAGDLLVGDVDLAARQAPAVVRPADLIGRTLARAVTVGQAVRADDLRPRRYFAPGEPVALTVRGDGFQVAGQGTAITPGDEGQCAPIRTDSGRVVCGVPVGERRAEIAL